MTGANILTLPQRLDHEGARALHAALGARRGTDVRMDAAKTVFLGALGLQLLLSAARQWREGGQHFSVSPCSPAFTDDLLRLGAYLSDLNGDQP